MKILNYSVIVILAFSMPTIFMSGAFAQNDTSYPPLNDLGDGNVFYIATHGAFLPGQTIEITGNLVIVDSIRIALDDPDGKMVTSKTTFSDRDGYFASELKIPSDAGPGIWKIVGTSGIYHRELKFTIAGNSDGITCYGGDLCSKLIANSTVQNDSKPQVSTGIESPLKQFESGITASDVQCIQGLELVIKVEDGSPACVKFSTAESLIKHGWASSESGISSDGQRTYVIQDSSAASKTRMINNTSCNTPYLRSDSDITVLYMPTNSTGKICVQYYNLNNTPVGVGIRIFEENNMTQNAPDIITWASNNTLQGNENTTISYFIKTGNKAGFYGLSMFCGGIPFAVGYDANSTITAKDFSALERVIHCPAQSYSYTIEGVEGIGIRYIPYP